MLRPAITQIITKNESYYSLVIGVAKRARAIADELYDKNEILKEKPVKTAVEEFASGKYKIVEYTEHSAEESF
jgi:DNA-directed RNA polymerase subunit omega